MAFGWEASAATIRVSGPLYVNNPPMQTIGRR